MTRNDARLRRTFGISQAEYDQILAFQGGVCAICLKPPKSRRLAVDHRHDSGQVTGLLCSFCNRGLQFFRDLAPSLGRAKAYLLNPPAQKVLGVRKVP